jgi:membrane protein implicated in regulation of membrane protease activity
MESILSHQRLFRSRRLRAVVGGALIVGAVVVDLLVSTQAALPIFLLVAAVELIVVVGFVRDRLSTRRSNKER